MNLLIFFAIPLATILLSIVLEKILDCPILVAITFFSIYLIITVALFAIGIITDLAIFLIAVIVYTILAFITAYIVRLIKTIKRRFLMQESDSLPNLISSQENTVTNNDCGCSGNTWSGSIQDSTGTNTLFAGGNFIPNQSNRGRTGLIRGCYRRN